jgi:putative membrane protein
MLATENSLNQSMNTALKHYSSLFFLPSFKRALFALAVLCIGVVGLSTAILFPSVSGLINGLFLGLSLFSTNIVFDYIVSRLVLMRDSIFILRRTVGLSVFCWILWLFFIILGIVFGTLLDLWWWIRLCLLGFSAVLTLRANVFFSISSTGFMRRIAASLLQPFSCIVSFLVFWAQLDSAIPVRVLPFLVISPIAGCALALLFVSLIDRAGRQTYGVSSMSLFKAFMLNWVADITGPFEEFLEKLGKDEDVEVSFLKFDSSKPKAAIIVPLVHPGPFKNIGSSLLPSMLKQEFENEFGCDACVPLGILGHELDLASQAQNQKIIDRVKDSAKFVASSGKATPFVRVTDGSVTASCQVFGNAAFLSLTLAPKTTEDLPQELGRIVREEAGKHGLDCAIIVNAHNSINDTVNIDASLPTLCAVASDCLKQTVSLPSQPFEVGAATVFPKEFSLKDGMGPGGITVIVVRVAEQKSVYVIIDGNNMISGLREEILSALTPLGFHEGEVFTTDTHAVSAVILGRRGYHPIGEVMNHERLISYIKEAAKTAAAKLESSKAGCRSVVVPKVRVIGDTRLESLSTLIDKALQKAKQIVIPIFAFEGLFLIFLLAIL